MHFEDLSNEVILCIWDQLLAVDVICSFYNLNNRMNSLLYEFCGLYTKLDLRYSSLSMCRYFCRQIPNMIEWCLGLTVLKLGDRYRSCQLEMFTNEIVNSFISRQKEQCNNKSNNLVHVSMANNHSLQSIFPHLVSLVVFQTTCITDECRDALLYVVAGGSAMRTFTWRSCHNQTHHSKAFFDWLFRCSHNLNSYQLTARIHKTGFELTYEHTLTNGYNPHSLLINLKIILVNLVSLHILLHYLPELQHLGNYYRIHFRKLLNN
jgi:hypothetical protein